MQKQIFLGLALCLAMTFIASPLQSQGLVVNEVSNGPSGTQEYIELVVVGPTLNPNCGPIDIRGWIIDDNNGDFSCGACAGTGIASGHLRFANLGVWSAVPTGSIIVIYDPTVKNPKIPTDDHDDLGTPDKVYVLSSSDAFLEASTTPCAGGNVPSGLGSCGSCSGIISYTGACYTAGVSNAVWGLRNAGDAAQVRRPNGTYFHGLSFGTAASLMNGGPDGLQVSTVDGSGRCYSFMNSSNDNFRLVANFATATVASNGETPGIGNSVANITWINSLTAPCLLPVSYARALEATPIASANLLTWATAQETNSDRWEVLRSENLTNGFAQIGTVAAAGYSSEVVDYSFTDLMPQQPTVWYQLRQIDRNGAATMSNVVLVSNGQVAGNWVDVWPNPSHGRLQLRGTLPQLKALQVVDLLGRVVYEAPLQLTNDYFELEIDLGKLAPGNYLLQLHSSQGALTRRISLQQ